MTPKPWYFSKSILGSLVAALVYIAGLFGLHLADLAPQILDGISKQIDATMTIAGIVFAIYGRVVATKAIKSGSLPPGVGQLLLVLAPLAVVMSLFAGCSSISGSTYTYTPAGATTPVTITGFGAWCENNLPVIRSATKSSIVITANVLTKNGTTTTRIAGYVRDAEAAILPLLGQSRVSDADLETALSKVKVNDPSGIYANAIDPAIELVGGYIVQLQNDGVPEKVTIDVLTALNGGLNDAAVALDPTSA